MKIETNTFARKVVLNELQKRNFNVRRLGRDFLIDGKKINVRGCNYNNSWATKDNVLGGWDKLDPKKFDYFIGVSFSKNFDDIRFFIFTKSEALNFPITGLSGKDLGLRNLTLHRNHEKSKDIIKISEDKWSKII